MVYFLLLQLTTGFQLTSIWSWFSDQCICYDLQLQECVGAAVTALGPEKMLTLLPISLDAENFTCSNIWLVPILKKYVIGGSLGYFMEHIMPLAESFERASHKGICSNH